MQVQAAVALALWFGSDSKLLPSPTEVAQAWWTLAQTQGLVFELWESIKVLLLVLAGINVSVFHSRTHRSVAAWDRDAKPPRAARVAAIISLAAWAGVVVSGRLVAYNWFSCDIQPQPAFVNWVSGCVAP